MRRGGERAAPQQKVREGRTAGRTAGWRAGGAAPRRTGLGRRGECPARRCLSPPADPPARAMLSPGAARLRGWAWRAAPALRWCQALHDRSRSVLCGLAGTAAFPVKSRPAGSGAAQEPGRVAAVRDAEAARGP